MSEALATVAECDQRIAQAQLVLDNKESYDHAVLGEADKDILRWRYIRRYAIELEALNESLRRIAQKQPETLEVLRSHEIVFDDIGDDPKDWQHVAFTIYTDLCEVDTIARVALQRSERDTPPL